MELYVIRHGQSLENIGRATTPNCGLSELGQAQAERLAVFFAGIPLDAVFSSPFRRAVQTAMPTVLAQGLRARLVPELGEIYVNYEGAPLKETHAWETPEQIGREFPHADVSGERAYCFPDAADETWEQVCARCERFYRRELAPLCADGERRAVAVFGHGATTDALKLLLDPCFDLSSPYETNALAFRFRLDAAGACLESEMHYDFLGEHIRLRG